MKLKLKTNNKIKHKGVCSSVSCSRNNILLSVGDDKEIFQWDSNGEFVKKPYSTKAYVTKIDWYPSQSKKKTTLSKDIILISCADGSFRILSSTGGNGNCRLEKIVKNAHQGAILSIKWNHEGTALITGGEDGVLKVWAIGGQIRSILDSTGKCIYSLAWGPDSERVIFTHGKELIIKSIHTTTKQIQWKAHDGIILSVDWNPLTNLIVSGSEDMKYKVWDSFGRVLFHSSPFDHPITSVSWSPNGELFGVGYFNSINLCDKTGWIHSTNQTKSGSIYDIEWFKDGTQFCGSTSKGEILFAEVIEKTVKWKNYIVTSKNCYKIEVENILDDSVHKLDFNEKIVKLSINYGYLVVITTSHCWIYNISNSSDNDSVFENGKNSYKNDEKKWNTPRIIDVKDIVHVIIQSEKNFLIVDNFSGVQCFSYQGRLISNPKFSGLRPEFLDEKSISLSNDYIAIINKGESKSKAINFYKIGEIPYSNGKNNSIVYHNMEIDEIEMNQYGNSSERKLVFIDRNRDLYIVPLNNPNDSFKLGTMVDSAKWHDKTDQLVAICDGKLNCWYYPDIVFMDKDLLEKTIYINNKEISNSGKKSIITSYTGTICEIKKWNGANVSFSINPFLIIFYELISKKEWEKAIRLCRYVKDESLWACLAAISLKNGNLETTEVALATILEIDKLEYIQYIMKIQSNEVKNAEIALYQRKVDEAEKILLQSGYFYRAIKMHIRLFNWERALEIAQKKAKNHIDTVLFYRMNHLVLFQRKENLQSFMKYKNLNLDVELIKKRIKQEKEKEGN